MSYSSLASSSDSEAGEGSLISKIIGINHPEINEDQEIFYFVKLKGKPYKECCWKTEEQIVSLSPQLFQRFLERVRNYGLEEVKFPTPLYKPRNVDFDISYINPTKILSHIYRGNGEVVYLTQWGKLPIKEASWESQPPKELIDAYLNQIKTANIVNINEISCLFAFTFQENFTSFFN